MLQGKLEARYFDTAAETKQKKQQQKTTKNEERQPTTCQNRPWLDEARGQKRGNAYVPKPLLARLRWRVGNVQNEIREENTTKWAQQRSPGGQEEPTETQEKR